MSAPLTAGADQLSTEPVEFRLLGTGSRNWSHWASIDQAFTNVLTGLPPTSTLIIVHGDSPDGRPRRPMGFDAIADRWARSKIIAARHPDYWIIAEPWPAEWREYGKRAGMRRNQQMVDKGADLCLGAPLPGSRGTWDCMRRAAVAGIPVRQIPHQPPPLDSIIRRK